MNNINNFGFFTEKVEYFLSQGKGISVYNANQSIWSEFEKICEANSIANIVIYCSRFEPDNLKLIGENTIPIIIQDLPINDYRLKAVLLADQLIFPLWYNRKPICFFSTLDKSEYRIKDISSTDIHINYQSVINFLMVRQINSLLSFNSLEFSSPEFLALPPEKTTYTPIEQKMADELEKEKIAYVPQVHIGRFYVDFLVSIDNQKIIVECDGREFHDPARDHERDEVLALENYPIVRFSGSEINRNISQCVEKIKSTSLKNSRPNYPIDDDVDSDQRKGIGFITGPVRVLAPAGSGKTKTLINRIANLINNRIPQDKILALAFNNKAQKEMASRLYSKNITEVSTRTFHSLGMEIIRNKLRWNFQGKNEKKITRDLLKSAIDENIQLPRQRNKDPFSEFHEALNKAKMELLPLAKMEVEVGDKLFPFEAIFYSYLKKQTAHNFFNFDDMIYLAVRILLDDDQIRQEYQRKYEYILVDEYQDLNKAQLLFLLILSLPYNNLFVVGDDDQMIYGWRGAEVRHIVDFHKRFSILQDCVLETNYRSSKNIVRHSRWLIDHNSDRVTKNIHARADADEGVFEIQAKTNLWEQAQFSADWINQMKAANNSHWKDFAVLFRYNEFAIPIAMALDACKVPHSPVDNVRLFKSQVGQDIFAYLSVILYPEDAKKEDFARILKRPNKYLKNELIEDARDWNSFISLSNRNELRDYEQKNLKDFLERINILRNSAANGAKPRELLSALVTEIGLMEFYSDKSQKAEDLETASDDMLLDVIQSISSNYADTKLFFQTIDKSIHDEIETEIEKEDTEVRDEVLLSTIHKSKGKEFENVVFLNLSQEKHKKSAIDIEEERRVAYVGITRAKKKILVTFLKSQPSEFVKEMALNPDLRGNSTSALKANVATAKIEISKFENELKIIGYKKNEMLKKFPELDGKDIELPTSFSLINRFKLWMHQRQMASAFKKITELEEKSSEISNIQLKPKKEEMSLFQSELIFREILEQKKN